MSGLKSPNEFEGDSLDSLLSDIGDQSLSDGIIWSYTDDIVLNTNDFDVRNKTPTCCVGIQPTSGSSFQEGPDFLYIIYTSYISLVFVLGLSQNAVSLYVFIKERCIRKVHNVFIVGLAVSDVCMCLFGTWMVFLASAYHRWIFGRSGCVYYGFATTLLGITQISLLATIALDRYIVIVRPSYSSMSMKMAVVMVTCCYGYGFLWAFFPALGWSSYQLEGIRLRCAINWRSKRPIDLSYSISILIFAWVVPLGIILYCYGGICSLIWREKERPASMLRRGKSSKRRRRERRVAVTVLLMIGAFFISWTPYSIVTLIVMFGKLEDVPLPVTMIPTLMAKTSIIWNPIIYVARHNDFRKACLKHVPCISWIKNALTPTSTATSSYSYSV